VSAKHAHRRAQWRRWFEELRGSTNTLKFSDRTVITRGLRRHVWLDLYHYFMTVSWPRLFLTFAGYFFTFNLFFAFLYWLDPGSIANLSPAGFWGDYFFSVETLATVGYGDMHPVMLYAHIVAAIEIFIGLMSLALMTGAMFARFSRPQARILFARHVVVRPIDGRTTLMFRAANARQNVIVEAVAQLRMIRDDVTVEGYRIRRIIDMPLVRHQHPIFLLGWNLMHVIDEKSPLAGETTETLMQKRATLLLTLSGTDETTGQVLIARHAYRADAIRWNHTFHDMLTPGQDGVDFMDYEKFHSVEPLGAQTAKELVPEDG
jgi:inward rectifier potassium channel